MYQKIIKDLTTKMEGVVDAFTQSLKSYHTGRASAAIVENIKVNHYNSLMPIIQLATISIPESNIISIAPWDVGALNPIENAIKASGININPINDGKNIRLVFPAMTTERREELKKAIKTKEEEARVALRTMREDTWKEIQKMEKNKSITEDDRYAAEKELNKLIEEFNETIEKVGGAKIREIEKI
ncbi:MAG: ribosome recycling factor [Candidatus Berkelbacteria bacterium Licking1014_85]|uniref:Ribosome-recycling factor n=1 Tax=Candidatus Berkelbacteria bacterium Licking1014_85 TaxID=2017148 RepID=A0A554LHC0_9BACT|nr:MAG: ribosome recycling factor [Candidatus Berkelbacteria bacterium Licking1014_85]